MDVPLQENLWKSITLQNERLQQYRYLIALKFSNASDHIFIPWLGKYRNIFRNFPFLNRILGLRQSFSNQTTYLLKNQLWQQIFLNWDSFLNRAFLNQDWTACISCKISYVYQTDLEEFSISVHWRLFLASVTARIAWRQRTGHRGATF